MVRMRDRKSAAAASDAVGRPAQAESSDPITTAILSHAGAIAADAKASALFVYAEALAGWDWTAPDFLDGRVFYVVRSSQGKHELPPGGQVIEVPDIRLGRMDQVKIAVLGALLRGLLDRSDVIVCLSGAVTAAGSTR